MLSRWFGVQVVLEGVNGMECWWINRQHVPVPGSAWEGVWVCNTAALWLHNTRSMTSGNRLWQAAFRWEGNVHLVIEDLVGLHHDQAAVSATLNQVLDHSGDTAIILLVACDISARVTLDLFKLVGVPAGVGIPDSGSVLESRPNIGSVGYVTSIFMVQDLRCRERKARLLLARLQMESAVAGSLLVPWTRTSAGQCSFAVLWSQNLQSTTHATAGASIARTNVSCIKRQLTTHLFQHWTSADCSCVGRVPSSGTVLAVLASSAPTTNRIPGLNSTQLIRQQWRFDTMGDAKPNPDYIIAWTSSVQTSVELRPKDRVTLLRATYRRGVSRRRRRADSSRWAASRCHWDSVDDRSSWFQPYTDTVRQHTSLTACMLHCRRHNAPVPGVLHRTKRLKLHSKVTVSKRRFE